VETINQEEIELYKELQSYFPQNWEIGNKCYHLRGGDFGTVTNIFEDGIQVWFEYGYSDGYDFRQEDFPIRIPFLIDPGDNERMARGEKPRSILSMIKNFMYLLSNTQRWICYYGDEEGDQQFQAGDTPTIALLKALKAQMEASK